MVCGVWCVVCNLLCAVCGVCGGCGMMGGRWWLWARGGCGGGIVGGVCRWGLCCGSVVL